MLISGVVLLIQPEKSMQISTELKKYPNITTYGIHKENYIIAVFEADDEKQMKILSENLVQQIDGVLGVYPTYMQFDEEGDE